MKKQVIQLSLTTALAVPTALIAQNILPSNGRVGVGTTAPQAPVEVRGAGDVGEQLRLTSAADALAYGVLGVTAGSDLYIQTHRTFLGANGNIILQGGLPTAGNAGGNVGIGTTMPGARLDVLQTQTGNFLRLSRLEAPAENLNIRGVNEPSVGTGFSFQTRRWNGGGYDMQEALYLGAGGNVGVGTTAPAARFDIQQAVNGSFLRLSRAEQPAEYLNITGVAEPGRGTAFAFETRFWNGQGYETRIPFYLSPDGNVGIGGKLSCQTLELTCDRNQKGGFKPVEHRNDLAKVVSLPIYDYFYTNSPNVIHKGPTAQDFKAAFNLGGDDKHIGAGDGIGVVLAAIKGLHEELQETKGQLESRDARIATLETKLATLEQRLSATVAIIDRLTENPVKKVSNVRASAPLQ